MEIADLDLSVRAFNAVCRADIKTIPELYERYQLDSENLRKLIGKHNFEEVGDKLAAHREEVWEENRRAEEQETLKPGDYLTDYDRELWGEEVTFDELAQMAGQLVIVNDSWYPEDELEEDGEGDVLLVTDADGDVVHLRGDTPKIYEITRLAMDDSVKTRYCTKVWKVKGSEAADMIEETKSTVIVSGDYTRAVALTRSIIANAQAAQQSLYEVCKGLKEMRDGKLYKELGYQNFEEYTENEVGIGYRQAFNYAKLAETYGENLKSISGFGSTKLMLLAKLDEPTREAVQESVDVESATVKELKAQIAKLEADKDAKTKQFQAALDAKETQLRSAKESGERSLSECKTYLNGRIRELEDRIKELEDMPVQHDLTDANAAEEIKRLKRELEDEQLRYTMLEGSANARARKAADEVRAAYEKKLAEVQSAEKPDTKAVFKAYLANAADAMKRLLTYLESVREDENLPLYLEKLDGIVEMTQERRNAL